MAYDANLITLSALASVDLSAHQYKFISLDGNGGMVLAGAGERIDGALQDKPAAGRVGAYVTSGVSSSRRRGDPARNARDVGLARPGGAIRESDGYLPGG